MAKDKAELIKTRKTIKANKPKIRRSDSWKFHRIKEESWRKPKGRHNKMRLRRKSHVQTISFSSPKAVKGLHSSGKEEIMIFNINDLAKVDKKEQVARLSSTLGTKKRLDILKKAFKEKIKILNIGVKCKKYLLEDGKKKDTKKEKDVKKETKTEKKEKKKNNTKTKEIKKEKTTKKKEDTKKNIKKPAAEKKEKNIKKKKDAAKIIPKSKPTKK